MYTLSEHASMSRATPMMSSCRMKGIMAADALAVWVPEDGAFTARPCLADVRILPSYLSQIPSGQS